ncbi:MAG: aspartate kinase [Candidatus Hydrothermarchaeaceae archaeon]
MKLIMKFGGSSVGNGKQMKETARIISKYRGDETAVVVSAMEGVTDSLIEIANGVVNGVGEAGIKEFIGELKSAHVTAAKKAVSKEHFEAVAATIDRLCTELMKVLVGVSYVGELTPHSLDYIMSFGERLSAPILSGAISSLGIKSKWLGGHEAGIVTDSNFGSAAPVWKVTHKRIKRVLAPLIKSGIPVVTGFVAGDEKGRVTTLGRGGSDFTASILGSVLGVDEIWIWTDVDGILSSNPGLVKNAEIVDVISYAEAQELAYFGAKVLHPKTIEPAMEKGIPVRVRNTFNPKNRGTLIVKEQKKIDDVVKAISVRDDVALLTVSGVGMIGVPGIAARLFGVLADRRINILMISQGSSEVSISLVIEKGDLKRALSALEKAFPGKDIVKDLKHSGDVSIVAVVGAGMRGTQGVAARIFGAAAKASVNILMIAQGSSEVNISFVVLQKDARKAANALHGEFIR